MPCQEPPGHRFKGYLCTGALKRQQVGKFIHHLTSISELDHLFCEGDDELKIHVGPPSVITTQDLGICKIQNGSHGS